MRSFKRTAREMTPPPTASTASTATAIVTAPASATSTPSTPPPMASSASSASSTSNASSENYFKFTDKHERFLVAQARRHASALVVDALYDPTKWQFRGELPATSALSESVVARAAGDVTDVSARHKPLPPAQHPLEVYELRASALDRVACVAPRLAADPQQLALRSHTLLARTRVRGKLDEFMGWMTTRRRAVHQGLMRTLHDGHMQHCDVFSGFDATPPPQQHDDSANEQFALKYMVVEPTVSASSPFDALRHGTTTASTAAPSMTATSGTPSKSGPLSATKRTLNFLRRKGSTDSNDPTQLQQQHQLATTSSSSSSSSAEGRVHFCVGEYSTVRPGVVRTDGARVTDPRIGIISYHSVEDPELLQLCNSVAKKTTPKHVRHCTSRTLLQYSGIVAYPVAATSSDDTSDDADYLEIVIKISCFDARGLSAEKRATMFQFIAAFRNLAHTMLVMRLRASPFLTATNWVADERRKCCLVCQHRFSSLRRRHHCRLCGEVTCAKCSAVHQVRLVKEAKASLRICLLCVQGVERPKWKESVVDEELAEQQRREWLQQVSRDPESHHERDEHRLDDAVDEPSARETEPIHLLDFSFAKELAKPRSPTSTATDSSSPEDRLLHSQGPTVSSSTESESGLDSTIRDFHDSAFTLPTLSTKSKPKRSLGSDDLVSLYESADDVDDEEAFELEPHFDMPRSVSPATGSVLPIRQFQEFEKDAGFEPSGSSIRRISSVGDGDDIEDEEEEDEDEDSARLQALAAYGLLETDNLVDGVMPEDLALQTIVKEVAQALDCAIAAIGFVDASRDMVSAAYSASPLCQVPRGVLPKQYSLTWDVMQRCPEMLVDDDAAHVVVLDAAKDPALKRNPFVLDTPFVRFMVGVPLRAWNGVIIGAMMVADIQPRTGISSDELLKVKSHATLVETWLENKREEIASMRSSARGGDRAERLHDRLAEMLNTSYKTTLELQMRGMQMQQQGSNAPHAAATTSTKKPSPTIRHVLF